MPGFRKRGGRQYRGPLWPEQGGIRQSAPAPPPCKIAGAAYSQPKDPTMSKGMDKKKDVKKKPSKTVKEKKEAKTAKKAKQDRL
jgi:hypothetical protein